MGAHGTETLYSESCWPTEQERRQFRLRGSTLPRALDVRLALSYYRCYAVGPTLYNKVESRQSVPQCRNGGYCGPSACPSSTGRSSCFSASPCRVWERRILWPEHDDRLDPPNIFAKTANGPSRQRPRLSAPLAPRDAGRAPQPQPSTRPAMTCRRDGLPSLLRRFRPRDSHGRISSAGNLCVHCLRFRPTRPLYWSSVLAEMGRDEWDETKREARMERGWGLVEEVRPATYGNRRWSTRWDMRETPTPRQPVVSSFCVILTRRPARRFNLCRMPAGRESSLGGPLNALDVFRANAASHQQPPPLSLPPRT